MDILLTGASGFIGRNYLLKSKFLRENITCLFNQSETFINWLDEYKSINLTLHKIDLSNLSEIKSTLEKDKIYDVCLYLAANSDPAFSFNYPLIDLQKNIVALVNLCSQINAKKLIYFSSGAVYEGINGYVNPKSNLSPKLPYSISKLSSEYYLRYFQYIERIGKVSIVRFFGAFGPYEPERKVYGRLVRQFGIEHRPDFIIKGDGKNLIDAMYIDDTITAIDNLIEDDSPPEIFDLSSGNPITITELVKKSASLFKISANLTYIGYVPEYIDFISNDNTYYKRYGNINKISLEEGLQLFYQFMLSHS